MSESRGAIIDALTIAARTQHPVRVERDQDWWADDVLGFVVSVGEHWVVLQSLVEAVYVDGIDIVRIEDVTSVEEDCEGGFVERAVASLGRPKVDFNLPEDADTKNLLRAAADHSSLICVYLEAEDDNPLLIGHLERLGERKFDIELINPRGAWDVETSRWAYKDVTRVTFGGRYEAALERFGEGRPV